MRIRQSGGTRRSRRCVEAAGGKFEHRLNLLPRYMKLLDDFLDARTCLKIFKDRSHGHAGATEYPRTTALTGDALHGGALGPIKRCHLLPPPFIVAAYVAFYHGSA